jgi:hypothetical protein
MLLDGTGGSTGVVDSVGLRGCHRAKTIPHAEHSWRPAS